MFDGTVTAAHPWAKNYTKSSELLADKYKTNEPSNTVSTILKYTGYQV